MANFQKMEAAGLLLQINVTNLWGCRLRQQCVFILAVLTYFL